MGQQLKVRVKRQRRARRQKRLRDKSLAAKRS